MNLGLRYFYMKMVLLEDVKIERSGGVFYMLRCEIYFLELGEGSSIFAECFKNE